MPVISKIIVQKRRANRRSVHLDGRFAFGCNANVIAKFMLREGMEITPAKLEEIKRGELRQECMDKALKLLERRLHGEIELRRKLARMEYPADVLDEVIEDLKRLDYLNDERFARTRALSSAQHRRHGRRRAMMDLLKVGVKSGTAKAALDDVYQQTDSTDLARQLAMKQAPRLARLDPAVARRRLAGMLQRRGFDYESIKPVIDEALGQREDPIR